MVFAQPSGADAARRGWLSQSDHRGAISMTQRGAEGVTCDASPGCPHAGGGGSEGGAALLQCQSLRLDRARSNMLKWDDATGSGWPD